MDRAFTRRLFRGGAALLAVGLLAACSTAAPSPTVSVAPSATEKPLPTYVGQDRVFTVSIVPLATPEQVGTFEYLKEDFAKGGVLEGKEIFGIAPSQITVYQGDKVTIHWVNPTDDDHAIAIGGDLGAFTVKGQSVFDAKFTANKAGLYTIQCMTGEHFPFMNGQLVVLPASAAPLP